MYIAPSPSVDAELEPGAVESGHEGPKKTNKPKLFQDNKGYFTHNKVKVALNSYMGRVPDQSEIRIKKIRFVSDLEPHLDPLCGYSLRVGDKEERNRALFRAAGSSFSCYQPVSFLSQLCLIYKPRAYMMPHVFCGSLQVQAVD